MRVVEAAAGLLDPGDRFFGGKMTALLGHDRARRALEALNNKDPVTIDAYQYDCVCNGFEIASGAIRNHKPEIMEKAFALAGYEKAVLEAKFGGMLNAFRFGAPPHGGCAFGIDRLVMLLADEPNLREVYAFVMNGQYEDQMMQAPSTASEQQLRDLHLKLNLPKDKLKITDAAE